MGLDQRDASVLRRFEHFCAVEGLTFDGAFHDAHVVAYSGVFEHPIRSFRTRLGGIVGRVAADGVVRSGPLNSPPSRSS